MRSHGTTSIRPATREALAAAFPDEVMAPSRLNPHLKRADVSRARGAETLGGTRT
jgi:ABC-type hemin transport system substrate-binding protein